MALQPSALQLGSLDSNSLPPPPYSPGVGRKHLGEQNILPVPPCSSQAFLGKPRDKTAHLLTAHKVKGQFGASEEGLLVLGHSHPPISGMMTLRAELPPSSEEHLKRAELGREGKRREEEARCVVTSSFYNICTQFLFHCH